MSKRFMVLTAIGPDRPGIVKEVAAVIHAEGCNLEDSRMAIREARRMGQAVFGITIDAGAKAWFPRIFGPGGFAVVSDPNRLTSALPEIYRHLVAG